MWLIEIRVETQKDLEDPRSESMNIIKIRVHGSPEFTVGANL